MSLEKIQIALFAAYDIRNAMNKSMRAFPTANENFGETIDEIIEILEQIEKTEVTITIPLKKTISDDAMATIATEAADAAIAYIQNKIGQTDGGFAGDFFSSEERWNTLTTVLFDYLDAEIKSGLLLKK